MLDPHEHVGDHLDDYLDHALSPTDVAILERRSGRCEACRSALDEAKAWRVVGDAFLAEDPAFDSRQDPPTKAAQDAASPGVRLAPARFSSLGWGILKACWAAMALVALILVESSLYYRNLSPTPLDFKVLG